MSGAQNMHDAGRIVNERLVAMGFAKRREWVMMWN